MSNTEFICNICKNLYTSMTSMYVHKREKHTFYNTKEIICSCCNIIFKSPNFNKNKNKYYDKCEECRDLSQSLKVKRLINKTYVYGINKTKYYINNGIPVRICSVYSCFNTYPCNIHNEYDIIECKTTKCNNCYIKNGFNSCDKCRSINNNSKNKLRNKIKELKLKLGGKCRECGLDDLFFLEFDHIDPSKKQKQITKSSPSHWDDEIDNLRLLCGRCHRMKSIINEENQNKNKRNKKILVRNIKKKIGCCQVCKWSIDDKDKMCAALDFDHIDTNTKFKQISNLYLYKKDIIINEISKTRLICRHCHEMYTCLQKGGKCLYIYYDENTINNIKNILFDKILQNECQSQINAILYQYYTNGFIF